MILLGIDVGTSGTKAIAIDGEGRTLAAATVEHPLSTPRPGFSEQDPEDWWASACAAIRRVLAADAMRGRTVDAVGLGGQMHGLVMLDGQGRTLRPCILWNDQRSAPQCERLERELGIPRLVELTGNRLLPGFTLPKILWCREHEPEAERRAAKHLLPKDWLRFRLSGGTYATEVSDASGTLLFDCGRRRWSDEMLAIAGIRRETLPDCSESPEVTSRVGRDAAKATGLAEGTPIVGGGGDQAAGAVGAGIVRPGRVSCTIGTSGVVFASKHRWRPTADGSLHAFCHAVPGAWHVMGVMLSAAGSFRWYRDTIARDAKREASERNVDAYDLLTAEAATVAPGCDGLTFLPYLTGERCPHPDAHARGALVGLAAAHGLPHLTRAVLEGITMGLLDNIDLVRSLGVATERVRLAGGGARSAFWRQMCADLFNAPVAILNSEEGGVAYGAALLAGVGVGAWKSVPEASDACVRETTEARPGPDAARYAPAVARFRAAYPRLAPIFRDASVSAS